MLFGLVPIVLGMPFQTLLVVFAEDVWDVGSNGFGALQACAGLGGLIGSIMLAFRGQMRRPRNVMFATLCAFGGTLFLFAISTWFQLALPIVLLADAFASTFTTMNNTTMQLLIPDHVRGRVMSVMMMSFGLQPLGSVPVSAAAEAWGAPAAVAASAVVLLVVTALTFVLSRSLRDVDGVIEDAMRPGALAPGEVRGPPAAVPAGGR
jgi:predicted MFS family arabinose efflux permease